MRSKTGIKRNMVYFRQRGRRIVGFIEKSTPTRYRIVYFTDIKGKKHVWRSKDKVDFMIDGRRGPKKRRKKTNPCLRTSANPDTKKRAIALSKKFHGLVPRRVRNVKIKWPKNMVLIGGCARLEYLSDKTDGKIRLYYHNFKTAAVYAAPVAQPGGQNMLVIIGKFKITADGIIG